MVILFLAQSYISISLYMKVSGEVVKNLYTLYFLQQSLLSKQQDIKNILGGSVTSELLMSKMAKDTGNSRFELRKSVEEFKTMTPAQRRSYQAKKNLEGDKMTKIIDDYTNIQKSLKDLGKNFKAEIKDGYCSNDTKEDEKNLNLLKVLKESKDS